MYIPAHFLMKDVPACHALIRRARISTFVTSTSAGPVASPLPVLLAPDEGEFGTLYAHLSKANPQWRTSALVEALAIFMGTEAYISPSWYETKRQTGKVVPTWNYETVHAYGVPEFIEGPDRILAIVTALTDLHEGGRDAPWRVDDAPPGFIEQQLRGIVALRIPIARLEGKLKMSQNRSAEDRASVAEGLAQSTRFQDRSTSDLIPR